MLTDKQIEKNYIKFREQINELFPSRKHKLNKLYDYYEDRIILSPASGVEHYHNAFAGGYVDHVLRVMQFADETYKFYDKLNLKIDNFSHEELMFAALNHDLGKIGLPGNYEQYRPNPSEWHRKNQGKLYEHDKRHPFMLVPDLSIFILQHFEVKMTFNELLSIRTHDGVFDRANEAYFFSSNIDSRPRTNINMILHQADFMAARFEFERWAIANPTKFTFFNSDENETTIPNKIKSSEISLDAFDDIFDIFNTKK